MKVGGGILHAAQNRSLDWSVSSRRCDQTVDHLRLVESLYMQVVHQIVSIVGSLVTGGALPFSKEDLLTVKFSRRRFLRVEFSKYVEFGRRREVQNFLKFRHVVNLTTAV